MNRPIHATRRIIRYGLNRSHQQQQQQSSSSFLFEQNARWRSEQRRHFFGNLRTILRNIVAGDDHTNPKKLLERRRIYFALLATQLRQLRLNYCGTAAKMLDYDALYDRAVQDLEAKNLDRLSNAELRRELQNSLHQQVLDIFEEFDQVDESLKINQMDETEEWDASLQVDWPPIRAILEEDLNKCSNDLDEIQSNSSEDVKSSGTMGFFERKRGALETVLEYLEGSTTKNSKSVNTADLLDDFGINLQTTSEKSLNLMRQYQAINLARSSLIRQQLGYSILTLKSLIPGAGRGAFIDGKALAGSLVAFQPGEVWPKEHLLTDDPKVNAHFAEGDNDLHVSLRFDDYVVDSRLSPVTILTRETSWNAWALGHMLNHPLAGTLPNCQSTMLNFTERMQLGPRIKYIPNTYARAPGWQSKMLDVEPLIIHSLCLIATRDVSNEELTYDYRLQSENTPEWYSIVKYGDSSDQEDQVVFFRDDWMK